MNNSKYIIVVLLSFLISCLAHAQVITTIAGPGNKIHTKNDQVDILPTITNASGVAVDDFGNVYVAEYWESGELLGSIFKFDPYDTLNMRAGVITKGKNIPPPPGHIPYPHGITLDHAGNIYVAGYYSHTALKITPGGKVTTVAGCGELGYSGDNGNAASARLSLLNGIAVDLSGNIYIADELNNVIRKVSAGGIITTFAGTGAAGYKGDGHPATHSLINRPYGVAIDKAGNLVFSDTYNNVIRQVGADGIISTIAGDGREGYSGDNGLAVKARLNQPAGLTTDNSGNIYVADEGNNVVRKIAANGLITTIAGNGEKGYYGDGGQAVNAALSGPRDVAIDLMGNMYIADFGNHVIRKVVIPLPFNVTPVNTLPLVTIPLAAAIIPRVFPQPTVTVHIFFTSKPMLKIPLLSEVAFSDTIPPVVASPSLVTIPTVAAPMPAAQIPILSAVTVSDTIPSVVTSPPFVTIPSVVLQTPVVTDAGIPMLTAKMISDTILVVTSPPFVTIPSVFIHTPVITEVGIPMLTTKTISDTIPVVTSYPVVTIPSIIIQTPGIKIPLLSAVAISDTIPSVVTSPPLAAIPLIIIQTPGVRILMLSATLSPVTIPFPDTLQPLVEIPLISIPAPPDIPPPPQIEEDKVTVSISADNIMTIHSDKGAYTSFTITNMLGETIIEKLITAKQTDVDVTQLHPGNYYINLKSEKETKTLRFVKEN